MKVLITGGAGFIGRKVALALAELGDEITVLDNLSTQIHGDLPHDIAWLQDPRLKFIRGSILDEEVLRNAMKGVECIVHLASETGTGQSMYEVSKYTEINVLGTAKLMEVVSSKAGSCVRKIILASSRSVYGEGAYQCETKKCRMHGERVYPIRRSINKLSMNIWNFKCNSCRNDLEPVGVLESDPLNPISIYASTKLSQEHIVGIICEAKKIDLVILRLQNVYGEGQSLSNPYTGILSIFSTRIREGSQLPIFEDGEESRDFVHVDDVVNVIDAAVRKSEEAGNIVVNVGSGIKTSVLAAANMLIENYDSDSVIKITGNYRVGDIRHNFADIKKMKEIYNIKPKVNINDGIKRFSNWVKQSTNIENKLEGALDELKRRGLMS